MSGLVSYGGAVLGGSYGLIVPGLIFGAAVAFCLFLYGTRTSLLLLLSIVIVTAGWIAAYSIAFTIGATLSGYKQEIWEYPNVTNSDTEAGGNTETSSEPKLVDKKTFEYAYAIAGAAGGLIGGLSVSFAVFCASNRFRRIEPFALNLLVATLCGLLVQWTGDVNSHKAVFLFVVWQSAVLRTISYALSRPLGYSSL